MIEPLFVEPSRLETAGNTLRDLVFPAPPGPIVAPGTDPVSAAVNATLPIIESPVTDGLPAVKAALTRTGSSIAAAAEMYTDTDERLGDHIAQVPFLAAAQGPAGGASADEAEDDKQPGPAKPAPTPTMPASQLGQLAGAAGTLGPVMQSMQGAMGSLQGMQGAGATPAQLADSNKADRSPDDQARLVDEKKTDEDAARPVERAEGAAPVTDTSSRVPGAPEATPSETIL